MKLLGIPCGHTLMTQSSDVSTMPARKSVSMRFLGESATVSLAMAAGQKYGLHAQAEKASRKPARKKAAAKRKAKR